MHKLLAVLVGLYCLLPLHAKSQGRVKARALLVTQGLHTEREKATAIAKWIGYHIKYDVKRYLKCSVKRYSSRKVLRRKKALCDEYSHLFRQMCEAVGITTHVVDGYTKDMFYDVNDPFYRVDHAWNAVFMDGRWYLADITFSSGSIRFKPRTFINRIRGMVRLAPLPHKIVFYFGFNEDYLFNKPEKFRFNHFPADPTWYLCEYKSVREIEADSNYFHERHRPDVQNLHDEEGRNCADCMSKQMYTPYERDLDMGPATADFNKKEEEYLVTTYATRGDSLYRYVQVQFKLRNYNENNMDSLEAAAQNYGKAIDTLRSHGRNIRVEYRYKIGKEKQKLERCKKQNNQVRFNFQKASVRLKGWHTYTKNRIRFLKEDDAGKKDELRLPDNVILGPKEKLPDEAMVQAAFLQEKNLVKNIGHAYNNTEKSIERLHLCFEKAKFLSGSIYMLSDSVINYHLSYHDDLKKVYLRCKKAYLDSVQKQFILMHDSLRLYSLQYRALLGYTDSLRKDLPVLLRKNYIMAKKMEGSNPSRTDSLVSKIFADFGEAKNNLSAHRQNMAALMETGREHTRMLMSEIYTEKRFLNIETKAERMRAKAVIRHYNNDRRMRALLNKSIENGLYLRKRKTRELQQDLKEAINKEKTKRTGK